ncbi:hypothetical protein GobsT_21330 [Gemmata obscuriglobus]|nr:DUF3160 domain-containing protein [Gemmata obscuriglobus]QEG27379.1 hypothetical protein GobsT_21330 [Gemmata obscuriglobus]VTS04273.1 Uncultured bacterium genome assembly Metasoil_fosmids_resub OS=uncultured bacterium PE=4 SV=1: DUF3160: DUF3160 [Gemmata obscuriglobus UQM 2246]
MLRFARVLLPTALAVALTGSAPGAPPEAPVDPGWVEVARKNGLTAAEIKLLREQKFLVTGTTRRQVFSPYVGNDVPVFITSDSVLSAYHVLLEESIYRMELANSRKLPGVLARAVKNLDEAAASFPGRAQLAKPATKRAAIFLGVARNLLDDKILPNDADVSGDVQAEVKRVVAGVGTEKPTWLGPPDRGFAAVDYSRFTPRGFYTRTPALQRHFRAVAWLQAIPFRLDRDEELVAFVLMRRAYFGAQPNAQIDQSIWDSFRAFLGNRDDWDLSDVWHSPKDLTNAELDRVRQKYAGSGESWKSQINDQLRVAPTEPGAGSELAFRFLSAYRLPDAVMFARTVPGVEKRVLPSGLDVAAALGSPLARDKLKKERPQLLTEIDKQRPLFKGDNVYADYLRCLGTLMERTEPDAPEFMKGEPWRIKTAQTALAGWAQMRHTWALQAKNHTDYLSDTERCDGFIEPVPEFYGSLNKLVEDTTAILKEAGALTDDEGAVLKEFAEEFRAAEELAKKVAVPKLDPRSLTQKERDLVLKFAPELDGRWDLPEKERITDNPLAEFTDAVAEYRKFAGPPGSPDGYKFLASYLGHRAGRNARHWERLAKVCGKLETLAHKQLRQVPFTADEKAFIRDYGKSLAAIMLYGGSSWLRPRDDAMRVVDVFSGNGRHLHVGIARPRIMWVLYPTKNGEVLCSGAIVPYAEFTSANRLTDGDWKALLDSPRKPAVPAWAQPVVPPERGTGNR